jgi:tripartite-type tricarboxylate transporter receptor subunit TctC
MHKILQVPVRFAIAILLIGYGTLSTRAQDKYPSRPIVLMVPAAPGGGLDTTARQLARAAERIMDAQFVIENRTGASGTIGITKMVNSPADGYTLAFVTNGMITVTPHTLDVPYTLASYIPVIRVGSTGYVMCVKRDFPANNAKEFIEHLKNNPNKYSYGNDGVGGTLHVAAEYVFGKLGVKAQAVPFRGGNETLAAFLGGHLDIFGGGILSILPYAGTGEAKCLLLTSAEGNALVPQASGLTGVGIQNFSGGLWFGLIAPKGTPQPIVDELAKVFAEAAEDKSVTAALDRIGAEAAVLGPEDFKALIERESAAFASSVKDLGLTP